MRGHIYIFFICSDPLFEMFIRDGSNEGSQCMFPLRNIAFYPQIIPVIPSYLELCFSQFNLILCCFLLM